MRLLVTKFGGTSVGSAEAIRALTNITRRNLTEWDRVVVVVSALSGVTDTLQMHWLGDLTAIWHPAAQETFSQGVNFQLMFDKLLEREWTADGSSWKPVPDLADTWEVSPDGLTWTFHLHPGVKWHDGQPFTANDVAFTVSRNGP